MKMIANWNFSRRTESMLLLFLALVCVQLGDLIMLKIAVDLEYDILREISMVVVALSWLPTKDSLSVVILLSNFSPFRLDRALIGN